MLRFDLERLLISGDLDVSDIEGAWNERFGADFGYKVERPSQGVLQDIHWAAGFWLFSDLYNWQSLRRVPIRKDERRNPRS